MDDNSKPTVHQVRSRHTKLLDSLILKVFSTSSSIFRSTVRMNYLERKRKHRVFLFCVLFLSASEGLQSGTPPTRRPRNAVSRSANINTGDLSSSLQMDKRKMVVQSYDVSPPRMQNFRDLENTIVKLGRSGKTDEALSLYHDVDRPSIRLMNGVIDACSRAIPTRLQQAFEIFESGVEKHGLTPNVFTFGALMNACNRDRNSSQALKLLNTMKVSSDEN